MPSSSTCSKRSRSSTEGEGLPTPFCWTPLHEAVLERDLPAAQQLLQDGADPNAACEGGITPAMVLCLIQCLLGNSFMDEVGLPDLVYQRLWAFSQESDVDDPQDEALLNLLLSHGARVDLVYPGDFDMLEAASIAASDWLLRALLSQQPYSSMMAGTWSRSSSSSQACGTGAAAAAAGDAGGTIGSSSCLPEQFSSCDQTCSTGGSTAPATCAVRVLDRVSQPLICSVESGDEGSPLAILHCGWDPSKHVEDAGKALLRACALPALDCAVEWLRHGADVNYQQMGKSALDHLIGLHLEELHAFAELELQLELARLLMAKGAFTADGWGCIEAAIQMAWVPLLQAHLEVMGDLVHAVPVPVQYTDPGHGAGMGSPKDSSSSKRDATAAGRKVLGLTPTELALALRRYTMAAMLIAFRGGFAAGNTPAELDTLEQYAPAQHVRNGPALTSEAIQGLLLAGLLRHAAKQAGQQAAVEAYDLLISVVERWHGLQQVATGDRDRAVQTECSSSRRVAGSTAASTGSSSCGRSGTVAAVAAAAAATGPPATTSGARSPVAGDPGSSSSQSSAVGTAPAAPDSQQAQDARLGRVLAAVHGLLQRPEQLESLLNMLVALPKYASTWEGSRPEVEWAPFCEAMRLLQQFHTLYSGSLVTVYLGVRALEQAATRLDDSKMHAIHHWVLGAKGRSLPLPLLLLLGVDVDEGTVLQDRVNSQAGALVLALMPPQPPSEEVQQQRLEVIKCLVAAGASYKSKWPQGLTALAVAAQRQDPALLKALLSRVNALAGITPRLWSEALREALRCKHWLNVNLLLEAVASNKASASAAAATAMGFHSHQLAILRQQILAFKQVKQHRPLTGQQLQGCGAPVWFTPPQLNTLKQQIMAFKQLMQHTPLTGQQLQQVCPLPLPVAPPSPPEAAAVSASSQAAAMPPRLDLPPAAAAAAAPVLVWAVQRCDVSAVRRLLAAGLDPNIPAIGANSNVLHLVVQEADAEGGNLDVIRHILEELLRAGADINGATTNTRCTPLMMALLTRKLPVAKLLLEYKPDLSPVDKHNHGAMHYAARNCGLEGVKLLLQEGCPLPQGGVPQLVSFLKLDPVLAQVSDVSLTARLKIMLKQHPAAGSSSAARGAAPAPAAAASTSGNRAGLGCKAAADHRPDAASAAEVAAKAERAAAAAAELLAEEEDAAAAAAAKAAKKAAKKQRQAAARTMTAAARADTASEPPPPQQQQQQQQGSALAGSVPSAETDQGSATAAPGDPGIDAAAAAAAAAGREGPVQKDRNCSPLPRPVQQQQRRQQQQQQPPEQQWHRDESSMPDAGQRQANNAGSFPAAAHGQPELAASAAGMCGYAAAPAAWGQIQTAAVPVGAVSPAAAATASSIPAASGPAAAAPPPPERAAAAGPAGSAEAAGVEYITPLPWLPSLRVPVAERAGVPLPMALSRAGAVYDSSNSTICTQAAAGSSVAGSGRNGPVASLPWMTPGTFLVPQQQQEQMSASPYLTGTGQPLPQATGQLPGLHALCSSGADLSRSVAADSATDPPTAWVSPLLAAGGARGAVAATDTWQVGGPGVASPAAGISTQAAAALEAGAGAVLGTPGMAAPMTKTGPRRRRTAHNKQEGERDCVVCWEAPPSVQLLPCKHTVLCRKCSNALAKQEGQECPMCRTPVLKRIDVDIRC